MKQDALFLGLSSCPVMPEKICHETVLTEAFIYDMDLADDLDEIYDVNHDRLGGNLGAVALARIS